MNKLTRWFFVIFLFMVCLCLCHCFAAPALAEDTADQSAETCVIDGLRYKMVDSFTGFRFPVLIENGEKTKDYPVLVNSIITNMQNGVNYFPHEEYRVTTDSWERVYCMHGSLSTIINENVTLKDIEENDYIREEYKTLWEYTAKPDWILGTDEEYIEIEGHPARLVILDTLDAWGLHFCYAAIKYNRYDYGFEFWIMSGKADSWGTVPKVTMDELRAIVPYISFRRSNTELYEGGIYAFYPEYADLSLNTKNGADTLVAGKKLPFEVSYANPEKTKQFIKEFQQYVKGVPLIRWTVTDTETGEEVSGITVNNRNELTADKGIDRIYHVSVTALSAPFLTSASKEITVIPVVSEISADPSDIVLYDGSGEQISVKAVIRPESIPDSLVSWKAAKPDIVEVVDNRDGTALIRPLKSGKTEVYAEEPGGKKARIRVSVLVPVEDLELKISGQAKPGGTVKITQGFLPKNAGNKNVEWSVDVGEETATIKNGTLKIQKDVQAGTVIHVTCTALGAAEPISRTIEIEVQ